MYTGIVIGLDPSDTAQQAGREGIALARAVGAAVHLVTAFSDSRRGGIEVTDERRSAEAMLKGVAATVDPSGRQVTTHAIPGDPAGAVVGVAREVGADLIVVGNRGAHGPLRALGSVAGAVLNKAPCAVLVVRTT